MYVYACEHLGTCDVRVHLLLQESFDVTTICTEEVESLSSLPVSESDENLDQL